MLPCRGRCLCQSELKVAVGGLRNTVGPAAGEAAVRVKNMTIDVWEYVYIEVAVSVGAVSK